MAFNNGVQFVCAPPTQKGITIGLADEEKYDYPNTITYYRSYFTHTEENSGYKTTIPYKLRNAEFLNLLGEAFNSARYQELDSRVFELENAESDLKLVEIIYIISMVNIVFFSLFWVFSGIYY